MGSGGAPQEINIPAVHLRGSSCERLILDSRKSDVPGSQHSCGGFSKHQANAPRESMGVHPSFCEKLQCSVRSFCSILWDVLFVAHLGYLVNEDLGGRIPEPVGDRPPLLDNVDPEKEDIY